MIERTYSRASKRLLAATLFLGGSLAASACGGTPDSEEVATTRQKIINGEDSTDAQDAAVLLFHVSKTNQIASCTGTLIAPNLVLTARHCVSKVTEAAFGCDGEGNAYPPGTPGAQAGDDLAADGFYVFTGKDSPFGNGTLHRKPAGIGKKVFHDDASVLCSHDLALVLLQEDVPGALIAPVNLTRELEAGETITAVGWGLTEEGQTPNQRMQRTGVAITQVGPFEGKGANPAVPPNDFSVGEAICSGDSGGPAISETTGAVIGVVSRGGNGSSSTQPGATCIGARAVNNYTKVAPFRDLILEALDEAGYSAWEEGGPNPALGAGGVACSDNAECQSNSCGGGKCVEACSAAGTCSSGKICTEVEGGKACTPDPAAKKDDSGCSTSTTGSSTSVSTLGALFGLAALVATRRRSVRGEAR